MIIIKVLILTLTTVTVAGVVFIKNVFQDRNQHQNEVGSFQEISFEHFLMVMSHFRPPTLKTTEEEKQALRKEKLRCEKPLCLILLEGGS